MTALMALVTNAMPVLTRAGACSLSLASGWIQVTAGRLPARAAAVKARYGLMLPSW